MPLLAPVGDLRGRTQLDRAFQSATVVNDTDIHRRRGRRATRHYAHSQTLAALCVAFWALPYYHGRHSIGALWEERI
jgi:hypothetical protein